MALVTPSATISNISGSIGSLTFRSSRYGSVVARRGRPTNAPSSKQLSSRAAYTYLTNNWRTLSTAQLDAWRALAQTLPQTNRLGQTFYLSAFQLFVKQNIPSILTFQNWRPNPPTYPTLPPLDTLTIDPDMFNTFEIDIDLVAPLDPLQIVLQGSRSYGSSPNFHYNRWTTFFTDTISGGPDTLELTDEWKGTFGIPQIGEYCAVRGYLHHRLALTSPTLQTSVKRTV